MKIIASKLVDIMSECGYVQKQGMNDFHKYKYATASDVFEKVNAALVKNKVAAFAVPELVDIREVTNSKGNIEHLATIKTTLTLIDCSSGESITCVGIGSGQDIGDKAVAKAQTMALKYAWMMTLNISTGDDPEADAGVDERNSARLVRPAGDQPRERCVDCNSPITRGVYNVSLAKYKRALCMDCQKKNKVA